MGKADLTPKQARFVEEYLIDFNATQAAIRAGYSKKTARQIGAQNLSKLNIAEALAARQKEHAERNEVTIDSVTEMLHDSREMAMREGRPAAAVSAAMGLAKLHGLIIDRQEQKQEQTVYTVSDEPVSEDEWAARHAEPGSVGAPAGSSNGSG